jgi:DMSO/TMAO reductase YedYZ heme-binding membrane subunit
MWLKSIIFAYSVFLASFAYVFVFRGSVDIALYSEVTALTGGILIGSSFALSGIGYFLDFLDSEVKYRREIGLLGYFFALAHAVTIVIRFPNTYVHDFPNWLTRIDSVLGLTALFILTYMAIISTKTGMIAVGKYWRPLLRTGYIAYGLLIIRAYILQGDNWLVWFETMDALPPPRLVLTIFALSVIFLRIVMEVHLRLQTRQVGPPSPVTATPASTTQNPANATAG